MACKLGNRETARERNTFVPTGKAIWASFSCAYVYSHLFVCVREAARAARARLRVRRERAEERVRAGEGGGGGEEGERDLLQCLSAALVSKQS